MTHRRIAILAALVVALIAVTASFAFAATKPVSVKKAGHEVPVQPCRAQHQEGRHGQVVVEWQRPPQRLGSGFKSKTATKVTYSRTQFAKAGTYKVVCMLHQALGQKMIIRVRLILSCVRRSHQRPGHAGSP